MPRPVGSKNKSHLNLTQLFRGWITEEDVKHSYDTWIELLNDEDPKWRAWALDYLAKHHMISADKMLDTLTEQDKIESREQFDALVKELLNGHSPHP